jgi:hypothetical protein
MIEKKKIELDKTRAVVDRLNEIPDPVISARQFVVMYFDELQRSGKSLKAIYQFLRTNGIDVGAYETFRTVYGRLKRSRKTTSSELASSKPEKPEKNAPAPAEREKVKNEADVKERPRGMGLRPIYLPDGTEIEIDPETGAKHFKIKSNRRAQE